MKLSKAIAITAIACIIHVSQASGQEFAQAGYLQEPATASPIALVQCQECMGDSSGMVFGEYSDCGDMSCGGCEPCGGCPPAGSAGRGGLKGFLDSLDFGGWAQLGFHTYDANARFNNHADRVNLHQLWMYAEKSAQNAGGFGVGGRIDTVYGVDAQNTQAFGIPNNHWDNQWDHGIYGYAIPQAYGEVAFGDTSVKLGHFFTLIGYEVVTAPDNFFYSHALTMVNSEPFTHTGALVTTQMNDFVTVYGGWSMGWDSGFADNGDAGLAGLSLVLTDNLTVTWTSTFGRLNENGPSLPGRNAGLTNSLPERGQMHSIVTNATFGDLNYVLQIDRLDTNKPNRSFSRDTFGVNNYLFFNLMDQLSAGVRFEWYNVVCGQNANGFDNCDLYNLTFGLNVKPQEFMVIRPEVRWDWDVDSFPMGINEVHPVRGGFGRQNQLTFGIDAIFTL